MKTVKNCIAIVFLLICLPCSLIAEEKITPNSMIVQDSVAENSLKVIEEPQFPGGGKAMTEWLNKNPNNATYPCTVFFLNGSKKSANIEIPQARTEKVRIETEGISTSISADSIDRIAIQTPAGNTLDFYYLHNTKRKVWVYKKCEGANASAYIGAAAYEINKDGTPHFIGVSARIQNANGKDSIIQPSFPLYVYRKKDNQLQLVSFIGKGYEPAAFREGISRILKDDPMLCEYLHEQKWDYEDLQNFIENYNPNRKEKQLTVNGKAVERKLQKLITEDLNGKVVFFIDYLHPDNKVFSVYGNGLNIGIRTTVVRFFTGSVGIGYGKAQYVDDKKVNGKYPDLGGGWQFFEVTQDVFSETSCFNANVFLGGQIPFRIQRIYLIPAAGWNFGTLWSMDFATNYHGLQLSFDLGYKMKYGNILFAGLNFRQMNSLEKKSDADNWVYRSHPRFFKYPDVDVIALRVGYKF